jgi:DNA-binding Lrp family transcriptional regulator
MVKEEDKDSSFLTLEELGEALKLKPTTCRRLYKKGVIPGIKIGHNILRFDYKSVREVLLGQKKSPASQKKVEAKEKKVRKLSEERMELDARIGEVTAKWNALAKERGFLTCEVQFKSKQTRDNFDKCVKDKWWMEKYDEALAIIPTSNWCMGKVPDKEGKVFRAHLGWFISPDTVKKLIEGTYKNRKTIGLFEQTGGEDKFGGR